MIHHKNTGAGMYGQLPNEEGGIMRVPQSPC